MANLLECVQNSDQQQYDISKTVNDGHLLLGEEYNIPPLKDDTPTFCVRSRSLLNTSSVLESNDRRNTWDKTKCNGHAPPTNHYDEETPCYSLNPTTDGADIPLLADEEGTYSCHQTSFHKASSNHCHAHLQPVQNDEAWKNLLAASIMCLTFMVAEVIGGYLAGSLAVMTDAAHLLSDLVGFIVSLFAVWMGRKSPTKHFTYGYYRAEILGAVSSVIIIWIITGVFVFLATSRVIHMDFTIEADTMIIVSSVGVLINIIMAVVLHGMCHHLGHKHSHDIGRSHSNINIRAAAIHIIGDLIQSIGVLISAIIIKFYPSLKIADPLCTFVFSLLVLCTTITIVKDANQVLMEGCPSTVDYSKVLTRLQEIDGVVNVHGLQLWSITLHRNALTAHLAVDELADSEVILQQAVSLVQKKFDIHHSTIQVERYQQSMKNCLSCQSIET